MTWSRLETGDTASYSLYNERLFYLMLKAAVVNASAAKFPDTIFALISTPFSFSILFTKFSEKTRFGETFKQLLAPYLYWFQSHVSFHSIVSLKNQQKESIGDASISAYQKLNQVFHRKYVPHQCYHHLVFDEEMH